LRILIVGFGNVGQSLAKLLIRKRGEMKKGKIPEIKVVGILDSKTQVIESEGVNIASALKRKEINGQVGIERRSDFNEILDSSDPDVVVELTRTNPVDGEPGFTHIKEALIARKDVVTANKGPIALGFHALRELASRNSVQLRFSGTVGAGTPILEFGKICATGDEILSLRAILNSTSNYILTMMERNNLNLEEALALSKERGYAEADSRMDISGKDTALKLVIVVNYLLGKRITLDEIYVKGIENIDNSSIRNAIGKKKRIRLVASSGKRYEVKPTELDVSDPLCVYGPMSAIHLRCRFSGDKYLVGPGAGGTETAIAVLRDILYLKGR
jgi:homoserine dehydrogenase